MLKLIYLIKNFITEKFIIYILTPNKTLSFKNINTYFGSLLW